MDPIEAALRQFTDHPADAGAADWVAHCRHSHFRHGVVLIAMLRTLVVVFTSFLKTNGPVFVGGFGPESYARILRAAPEVIGNSFLLS